LPGMELRLLLDPLADPAGVPLAERGMRSLSRFKVIKDGEGISFSDLLHRHGSKTENASPCSRQLLPGPLVNDIFFRVHRQSV